MAGCVFTQLFNRRHTPPIAVWNRLCQPSTEVASAFFSGGSRYPARADPEYFRNGSGPDGFRCIAPPGASIPESADSLAHPRGRRNREYSFILGRTGFQYLCRDDGLDAGGIVDEFKEIRLLRRIGVVHEKARRDLAAAGIEHVPGVPRNRSAAPTRSSSARSGRRQTAQQCISCSFLSTGHPPRHVHCSTLPKGTALVLRRVS